MCVHAQEKKKHTNVVLPLRFMQGNVLPNKDTNADSTEVEAIQKLMYLWELCQPISFRSQLSLQLCHTDGHDWDHIPAGIEDA